VARECTVTSIARRSWRWPRLSSLALGRLYRRADAVVCQSRAMREDLARSFCVPYDRMTVIPNPVDVEAVRAAAADGPNPFAGAGPGPHLVMVGRFAPVKGFDRVIRALGDLHRQSPGARLWLVGPDADDGRLRAELGSLARAQGVEDRVHFPGYASNPFPYLRHADLFVLASRAEALPNVLLEALACDCPVVALDAPGGTREVMELTNQMHRLRPNLDWRPEWFRGDGDARPADLSAFSLESVLRRYERLLSGLGCA